MSARTVIATARKEVGYVEKPTNITKYGKAFGWDGVPWCVIFLWWCFREAGEATAFFGGAKTASCGTLLRWYQAQGLTVPVDEVKPGDLVFMNFHYGPLPEHIGIAESVVRSPLQVTTIEGNTTPGSEGSQDNGGCVARKVRYRSQIVGVARPEYKEEEVKHTDYDKHWAKEDIDWAVEQGLMKGYPDGTFQPDKPVTRAEIAVILHRIYSRPIPNDD